MGAEIGGMIDILFLLSGVYLIYTACMAKKKGNIASNVMLSKDVKESSNRDRAGFIEYMYKRIIAAGILIILGSVVHLVNDYSIHSKALTWVGIAVILLAIAVYTAAYLRGQKRYLR